MSDPRSRGSRTGARISTLLSAALCVAGLAVGSTVVAGSVVPVAALLAAVRVTAALRRLSAWCEPAILTVLKLPSARIATLIGVNVVVAAAVVSDTGAATYLAASVIAVAFVAVSMVMDVTFRSVQRALGGTSTLLQRPLFGLAALGAFTVAQGIVNFVEFRPGALVTYMAGAALVLLAAFTSAAAAAFAATWPAGGYRYTVVAASVAAFEVVSLNSAGVSIVLASTLLPFLLVTPWFAQYETRLTTD